MARLARPHELAAVSGVTRQRKPRLPIDLNVFELSDWKEAADAHHDLALSFGALGRFLLARSRFLLALREWSSARGMDHKRALAMVKDPPDWNTERLRM